MATRSLRSERVVEVSEMGRFAQHDPGFGGRRRNRTSRRTALDFDEPQLRRRRWWIDEEDREDEGEDWWLDLDEDEWIGGDDDRDDFGGD